MKEIRENSPILTHLRGLRSLNDVKIWYVHYLKLLALRCTLSPTYVPFGTLAPWGVCLTIVEAHLIAILVRNMPHQLASLFKSYKTKNPTSRDLFQTKQLCARSPSQSHHSLPPSSSLLSCCLFLPLLFTFLFSKVLFFRVANELSVWQATRDLTQLKPHSWLFD